MNFILPQRVAVLGPGLLGGSILMALKERYPHIELRAWARREAAVAPILEMQLATLASASLSEVLEGVDFVVLCTPVETMADLSQKLLDCDLAPGCLITDVGSVKGAIVADLEKIYAQKEHHYVGSHPMAGSEKAGLEAARANLFEGQTCIVTPTANSQPEAVARMQDFWQAIGCRMLTLGVQEHDYAVARISHLPRLAASIVTQAALAEKPECVESIGNGFRDTTRVASGDPGLWTGIVMQNHEEVLKAVEAASEGFLQLVEILKNKDEQRLHDFLVQAKQLRDLVSTR